MIKRMVCLLCVAALALSAQVAYGQDASAPPVPGPAFSPAETKSATPAQDKWEFAVSPLRHHGSPKRKCDNKGD